MTDDSGQMPVPLDDELATAQPPWLTGKVALVAE